ncbi:RND transporter [Endozoicomonas sp. OPT23]|uniref:efflux RND transporter permease subunit n=1 Tax=Endozoicomonas sp. OPT23 TaxID=2072845 RepID=UPI00129AEBB3|nr:MMPL family transporter [Endozoicomonas sp. OPT23]MRI35265.1 RND transporter [Endozoicomonas sp. OPT23]
MSSNHTNSEPLLERLIFKNRVLVCVLFLVATIFLSWKMVSGLRVDASFTKMIPLNHPFIQNMLANMDGGNSGNTIRIAVENKNGDIFDADYMEALKDLNDEIFFLPGVDRSKLQSLWTPSVRWTEVTEEGFAGGPVIPSTYNGDAQSMEDLRRNILRSGQVGQIVANDFKSSILTAPLFDFNPETGKALDYQGLSDELEKIREKYDERGVSLKIVGIAKVFGDLFAGVEAIVLFFIMAIVITALMLFIYSRCLRSTLVPLFTSLIAVVWQIGLLATFGYGLDLYSVLVPFLIFAIGVSHGVQIINSVGVEAANGADKVSAARRAFRSLYIPGMVALASDGIGFLTLLIIEIQVIQDLAVTASIGVAAIILTNLVLLPVLMSYAGSSKKSVARIKAKQAETGGIWALLSNFAHPKVVPVSVVIAILGFGFGVYNSKDLKVGDLDPGAPEFHPDSRYNLDNNFITANYSTSSDQFVVMVTTGAEQCSTYPVMEAMDRYMWNMENVKGVQQAISLVTVSKQVVKGLNEGNIKWQTLSRNPYVLNSSVSSAGGLFNADCSLAPVVLYLDDHKAETLERVVAATEAFAAANNNDDVQFLMATGNAGIEAATNQVIGKAQTEMLIWVYLVVSVLCLLTFRSLRAVFCIIIPLGLTSVLCQALMAYLGIGVKVATLPVIALGVGIGVDYGIYIYSRLESLLKEGMSLQEAYHKTLQITGKAVTFTGMTLAIGVGTWIFSPLKFQADMGILLTFMFIWNMIGAIWLLPALARFFIKTEVTTSKKPEAEAGLTTA